MDKGEKEKAADSVVADMKVEAGANNGRVEADDLQTWILPIMGVLVLVYKLVIVRAYTPCRLNILSSEIGTAQILKSHRGGILRSTIVSSSPASEVSKSALMPITGSLTLVRMAVPGLPADPSLISLNVI